jgi:hypothetical protein
MATATTRRKASLSSAERLSVVFVVYVVVKLTMSSEAAKNIDIASYCLLLLFASQFVIICEICGYLKKGTSPKVGAKLLRKKTAFDAWF